MEGKIDVGQNTVELITKLAHQIGTTADKVYPWYVKQQYIEGLFFIITTSLFFIISVFLCTVAWEKADFVDGNQETAVFILAMIIAAITLIIFAFMGIDAISKIFNPEYHAIHCMINDLARLR